MRNMFKNLQVVDITTKYAEKIIAEKPDATPEEVAAALGFVRIPKFPVNSYTYRLRDIFGQLTKKERDNYEKDKVKKEKINKGFNKIYAFLDRSNYLPKVETQVEDVQLFDAEPVSN